MDINDSNVNCFLFFYQKFKSLLLHVSIRYLSAKIMLTGYRKRLKRKEKKEEGNNTQTRQKSIFRSVTHTSNL